MRSGLEGADVFQRGAASPLREKTEGEKHPVPAIAEGKFGWHVRNTLPPFSLSLASFPPPEQSAESWFSSGGLLGINRNQLVWRSALGEWQAPESRRLEFSTHRGARSQAPTALSAIFQDKFSLDAYGALLGEAKRGTGGASVNRHNMRIDSGRNTAKSYNRHVEYFARRYSLSPSLIYAIMRVESGFNPLAVSDANALGLMQIVPHTAGEDAHAYLTGENDIPQGELLFSPEKNIQYGIVYLHLLNKRYFKKIQNPVSREMCVIAAYNSGPSPLLRVFSPNRNLAFKKINSLAPQELYERLVKELPQRENREYLPKVLAARNVFLSKSTRAF